MSKMSLSKNERLKSRKSIEFLFQEGKSFAKYPIRVVYNFQEKAEDNIPVLFGVTVSKRNFKSAPHRNRIKRLIREAFRTQCLELREAVKPLDKQLILMMLFQGKTLPNYNEVKESVAYLINGLTKKIK